jgi:short-subunit dehydrogenase/acyl dehydratase/acyl carrier protein
MALTSMNFADYKVGDVAVFKRHFTSQDFKNFSCLSGDTNPLHHDDDYAHNSEFGRTIVPIHLATSPLSRIAGMIFPGEPSLYLEHSVRAIKPIYYDEEIIYSARIETINYTLMTLNIRVIAISGLEVVMDAEMIVKSRSETWECGNSVSDLALPKEFSLVTGATGEIGSALSLALVKSGQNVLLLSRGSGKKLSHLKDLLHSEKKQDQIIEYITLNLQKNNDLSSFCKKILKQCKVSAIYHTAAPPIKSEINEHVQISYSALKMISEAALPSMLSRQKGMILSLGSVAVERSIASLQDYAATKAMAAQYTNVLDNKYSPYGVRGISILSGLVNTSYSAELQSAEMAMMPEELVEQILNVSLDNQPAKSVIIEGESLRIGRFGFYATNNKQEQMDNVSNLSSNADLGNRPDDCEANDISRDLVNDVTREIRKVLKLEQSFSLNGGGLDMTPGWDSLAHISLILKLENKFGVKFGSEDIENSKTLDDLIYVIGKKGGI